ncbi:MAG: bifunctional chorismate mutase/prephenate dehydratase [Anaerovoracaceae bacterium]
MSLEKIRVEIDQIDEKIVELFEKRIGLAEKVAEEKSKAGLPIFNQEREREVVSKITENKSDDMATYLKILYTTIFDISKASQNKYFEKESSIGNKIKKAIESTDKLFPKSAIVACQGIEGANSVAASEKIFQRPSLMYFNSFDGVFTAVESGLCQYGILPVENSLHGTVNTVYELMRKHDFHIIQSTKIKINHNLLAKPNTKLSDIKEVFSHEQALAQCEEYLKDLGVKITTCENTAEAAKFVAESERKDIAAVANSNCADLYNLLSLEENVADDGNNYTRFICISKKLEIYPGARKVSLMMTLPHKPGALYQIMAKFATLGINLSKLESRPLPEKDFEFMFYFDLEVSVYDEAIFALFSQLEMESDKFALLGCYNEI